MKVGLNCCWKDIPSWLGEKGATVVPFDSHHSSGEVPDVFVVDSFSISRHRAKVEKTYASRSSAVTVSGAGATEHLSDVEKVSGSVEAGLFHPCGAVEAYHIARWALGGGAELSNVKDSSELHLGALEMLRAWVQKASIVEDGREVTKVGTCAKGTAVKREGGIGAVVNTYVCVRTGASEAAHEVAKRLADESFAGDERPKVAAGPAEELTYAEGFEFSKLSKMVLHRVQNYHVATLRALSADMVTKANSGHPGMPMGMAPAAYVLWQYFMHADPKDEHFANRDRWILSNGHGSALQYSVLHLLGYRGVTTDALQNFRQLGSITPGHPEVHLTAGVEANTGPLGQGIGQGVGMAMAQKHYQAVFGSGLSDHRIYIFCGDGCLMEGVALEAISLAGHLGLDNITVLYDDNKITIDGSTELSFTQDVTGTFSSCGWHVEDVHGADYDLKGLASAISRTIAVKGKPSLIRLRTTIGFGSNVEGTHKVHGTPLPGDEVSRFRRLSGLSEKPFDVCPKIAASFQARAAAMTAEAQKWRAALQSSELKAKFDQWQHREISPAVEKLPRWKNDVEAGNASSNATSMATRVASGHVLQAISEALPFVLGGSADLTPSNNTLPTQWKDYSRSNYAGQYLRFGVREHAMLAIGNGLALYGGLLPYVATFLVFVGYAHGALRTGAIGHSPLWVVATHDSIGLGEDGPTHQPVELLNLCRSMPNVLTFRPADANETSGCYKVALERWAQADPHHRNTCVFALSRQNCPLLARSSVEAVARGAYVVHGVPAESAVILLATGSEVGAAVAAAKRLTQKAAVVSAPCLELFLEQDEAYLRSVLPDGIPVVSVEAGCTHGWDQFAHFHVGMTSYGASAPLADLMKHFGFTDENIASVSQAAIEFVASSPVHSIVSKILFQRKIQKK